MPMMQYDTKKLDSAYEYSQKLCQIIDKVEKTVDGDIVQFDTRVQEYYNEQFTRLKNLNLVDDVKKTNDFSNWLSEKIAEFKATKKETEESNIGANTGGGGGGSGYTGSTTSEIPAAITGAVSTYLQSLGEADISALRERLQNLGYTDEEIEKILHGEMYIHEQTIKDLFAALEGLGDGGKDFYEKLSVALGCKLLNEDGTLNKELFEVAVLMAQKGLGMNIDMTDGSMFKNYITTISSKLEELYKSDPSVRDKIKEKYGIDVFNDDGTVNIEKLALIKILDGMNLTDDYDLEKMLGITMPVTTPMEQPTNPTSPETIPGVPDGPTDPIPTSAPTSPTSSPATQPTTQPSNPTPSPSTSPTIGSQTGSSHGSSILGEKKKDDLKDASASVKGIGDGMKKALESGAGFLSKQLNNYKPAVATAKIIKTKGANVGVLAAASLAAGGAAAGGGVMLGKKFKLTTFTPDDWDSLSPEVQDTIESLMRTVGFASEEIDKFKTSTFKIPTEELKSHSSKVSDLVKDSDESEEALSAQYGYQIADTSGNVDEYLLFVTMIIDGKGYDDNYNIYNVINMNIGEDAEANFEYNGINLDDYIVEAEPKEKDEMALEDDMSFDTYTEDADTSTDISIAKSAALAIKKAGGAGFNSNSNASSDEDSSLNEF